MGLVIDGRFGGYPRGKGTWEPQLWDWAIKKYSPQSFADIGCGAGWAVKYFADAGIKARGYDGSKKAVDNYYKEVQKSDSNKTDQGRLLLHNFEDAPVRFSPPYDLIWSAEFVEHVEERFLPNILGSFQANKALLLLHALPGQLGHHHVNCQTAEYWIEKISSIGLKYDKTATMESRKYARSPSRGWGAKGLVFVPR